MKDTIKCFKMMRYALQFKLITIMSIAFTLFGLFFEFSDFGQNGTYSLAALYLALIGIYFYQMVFSSTVSKIVQSSSLKKKLQTSGAYTISFIVLTIMFVLYTIIRCLRITPDFIESNNTDYVTSYSTILFFGVSTFIMLIYTAFSYKTYIFSIIFLCAGLFFIIFWNGSRDIIYTICEKLMNGQNSPVNIIICAYILIILGSLGGYLISCALYKKSINDMAVRIALRQAQK